MNGFLKNNTGRLFYLLVCIICVWFVFFMYITVSGDKRADAELSKVFSENDKKDTIGVYVGGKVKNAGEYRLKKGANIGDAIEAAGGFTDDANRKINTDFILKDNSRVMVVDKSENANSGTDFRININTAGTDELMMLEGIGEKTAKNIIDYREENGGFTKPADIINVDGIGEKRYDLIKEILIID